MVPAPGDPWYNTYTRRSRCWHPVTPVPAEIAPIPPLIENAAPVPARTPAKADMTW